MKALATVPWRSSCSGPLSPLGDICGVGVILFMMVAAELLFNKLDLVELRHCILLGHYKLHCEVSWALGELWGNQQQVLPWEKAWTRLQPAGTTWPHCVGHLG